MSVHSFQAICTTNCHTLILGSMPGIASLDAYQYYAHKRNAFWPIMLAFVEQSTPDYKAHEQHDYTQRLNTITEAGFGLWDVLAECERTGSLDSNIKKDSVVMNDFVSLFEQHSSISRVAFNGKAAHALFKRHVIPALINAGINPDAYRWITLPSSSPAMASLSLVQKHEQWERLLGTND